MTFRAAALSGWPCSLTFFLLRLAPATGIFLRRKIAEASCRLGLGGLCCRRRRGFRGRGLGGLHDESPDKTFQFLQTTASPLPRWGGQSKVAGGIQCRGVTRHCDAFSVKPGDSKKTSGSPGNASLGLSVAPIYQPEYSGAFSDTELFPSCNQTCPRPGPATLGRISEWVRPSHRALGMPSARGHHRCESPSVSS